MKESDYRQIVKSLPKDMKLAFQYLQERINEVGSIHVQISEAEKQSILNESRILLARFDKLSEKVDAQLSKMDAKSEAINSELKQIAKQLKENLGISSHD